MELLTLFIHSTLQFVGKKLPYLTKNASKFWIEKVAYPSCIHPIDIEQLNTEKATTIINGNDNLDLSKCK